MASLSGKWTKSLIRPRLKYIACFAVYTLKIVRGFFVENGFCALGFIGERSTVPETAVQVNALEGRAWKRGL